MMEAVVTQASPSVVVAAAHQAVVVAALQAVAVAVAALQAAVKPTARLHDQVFTNAQWPAKGAHW